MDEQLQQIIERIHQAQNILVTVSANPSVDQLSAAIGLTLALNKLDKHGTAVYSGTTPSTIEFLKPEETLEKNTNSLRDFIIALDKSKADKLRYKVEDQVVRIFITPYRTSLSQDDLQFSQGDFNVDVVLALGVSEQQDLDGAITAHGRILHDATVVSIATGGQSSLGSLNWVQSGASSLSEMMVELLNGLDKKVIDEQIATALLTGIVANTERFRNDKTSPRTMSASATLMAAGANQQLIATQLEAPETHDDENHSDDGTGNGEDQPGEAVQAKSEPGTLDIDHEAGATDESEPQPDEPQPQVHVDENGQLITEDDEQHPEISKVRGVDAKGNASESGASEVKRERIVAPPQMGDFNLTANSSPEALDPTTEELTLPAMDAPLLSHNQTVLPSEEISPRSTDEDKFIPQAPLPPPPANLFNAPEPPRPVPSTPPVGAPTSFAPSTAASFGAPQAPIQPAFTEQGPAWQPPRNPTSPVADTNATLADIEKSVASPHAVGDASSTSTGGELDQARSAVEAALNGAAVPATPEPITALNAQPLGSELHPQPTVPALTPLPPASQLPAPSGGIAEAMPGNSPADMTLDMPLPANPFGPGQQVPPTVPLPPAPSAFPGAPQSGTPGQAPPPPVPPPMLPPLQ